MGYVTENAVRLRHGFYQEDPFSKEEEVLETLHLQERAYNIILLIKEGDTDNPLVDPTDYTFQPPNLINLVASGEFFDVQYGSQLSSQVVDFYIQDATAVVRSAVENQYESSMTNWETLDGVPTDIDPAGNPQAPNLIQAMTADLAGINMEIAWLRKQKSFNPDKMNALRQEKRMFMKALDDLQAGKLKLPGIDIAETVDGRAHSSYVFLDLPVVHNIDWTAENDRVDRRLYSGG